MLKHLVVIPDGNRRWALQNGTSKRESYQVGVDKLIEMVGWCKEAEIPVFTVWGFSTDNFRRDEGEVKEVFDVIRERIVRKMKQKGEENLKVRFFGRRHRLPWGLQIVLRKAESMGDDSCSLQFNHLLSYGGREELVDAINEILAKGIREVDEDSISEHLYTKGLPDPDLIIRTSGEQRLSGLMPWQSCYSELYFCKKLWPEFSKRDFHKALRDFAKRKRKYGR